MERIKENILRESTTAGQRKMTKHSDERVDSASALLKVADSVDRAKESLESYLRNSDEKSFLKNIKLYEAVGRLSGISEEIRGPRKNV